MIIARHLVIFFLVLIFSNVTTELLAFSYSDSQYKGKDLLMDRLWSINVGNNLGWLASCGENQFKQKIREKVKKTFICGL